MRKKNFVRTSILIIPALILTSALTQPVRAEDTSGLSLGDLLNLTVVTASSRAQKLSDAPANMTVITRQQIRERHYTNLWKLMADLPSVDVLQYNEEFRAKVVMRGNVANERFLILLNGQRISPISGEIAPLDDNYPLYNAKRVEILYGPASALYGADAFSGIVNIITQEPEDINGTVLSGSYGTDKYRYAYATVGHKLNDKIKFTLGAHIHGSDNVNLQEEYPDIMTPTLSDVKYNSVIYQKAADRTDTYFNKTSSNSVDARFVIADDFTVGFNHRYYSTPTSAPYKPSSAVYTDVPLGLRSELFYTGYNAKLTPSLLSETSLTYNMDVVTPDSGYAQAFTGGSPLYIYQIHQHMKFKEQLSYDITDRHNLIVGFSYGNNHSLPKPANVSEPIHPNYPIGSQDIFYPGTGPGTINPTGLAVRTYDLNYSMYAAYAQAQSKWTDWFSTTVGLRGDYDSRYQSTFNPRVGTVFQLGEGKTFRLLYGESFRAPSTKEMYEHYGIFNKTSAGGLAEASNFFLPNPSLKPEKARTLEFTYSHLITQKLLAQTSGYIMKTTNVITKLAPVNTKTSFAGGIVDSYQQWANQAKAMYYGLDFMLNYDSTFGDFRLTPWISYTLSTGRYETSPGNLVDLPLNSNHKVKGGATFRYKTYAITPSFRALSKQSSLGLSKNARIYAPGFYTVNLAAVADDLVLKDLSLSLEISNLLDRHYMGQGSSSTYLFPQNTRQGILELSYKLPVL